MLSSTLYSVVLVACFTLVIGRPASSGYDCNEFNPCTPENAAAGKFYFPNTDPAKFVQCSEQGRCWIMNCPNGLEWDVVDTTCNYQEVPESTILPPIIETTTSVKPEINECESNPCQNGGICADGDNAYTCACEVGYEGPSCETNINECSSSPCRNGATCVDGVNSYTCSCAPGYNGAQCQTDINECASNPCQNRGTCVNGINKYTCTCPANAVGTNCQTKQSVNYKVDVYTSGDLLSGTAAKVYIYLISSYDSTGPHALGHDIKDAGSTKTYTVSSNVFPILTKIKIGHDNSGLLPGWKLNKVRITNQSTGQGWWFYYNNWIKDSPFYTSISASA